MYKIETLDVFGIYVTRYKTNTEEEARLYIRRLLPEISKIIEHKKDEVEVEDYECKIVYKGDNGKGEDIGIPLVFKNIQLAWGYLYTVRIVDEQGNTKEMEWRMHDRGNTLLSDFLIQPFLKGTPEIIKAS